MKLIDVLVKIANGEEVKPFKIDEWECSVKKVDRSFGKGKFDDYIVDCDDGDPVRWFIYKGWLNKEVKFVDKKEKKKKKKDEDKFLKALKELIDTLEED